MISIQEPSFAFADDRIVISATVDNSSEQTLGLYRCGNAASAMIEKKHGTRWKRVYEPICLAVLVPPLAVAPGARQEVKIEVIDAENLYPELKSSRPGVYRLALKSLKGYEPGRYPSTGLETAWLVSNAFTIR